MAQFSNTATMKAYVMDVLKSKNIGKLPRTLAGKMDDYASAEFFGLTEKQEKYGASIVKICNDLTAKEFNSTPEYLKEEKIELDALKAKALIQSRRIRELSELRQRVSEKLLDIEQAESKIPLSQRGQFSDLLVSLQNIPSEEVES